MFLSVSGHNSEQSTAHYSSRPTVLQLKGVSDTMSNWFENHKLQRKQISTVGNAPYIQSSNHGLQCYPQPLVFRTYSFNSSIFKATSRLFGSQGYSDDKNWLDFFFPVFSLRFVDFAVQFWLRCKFSFHEKPFESSMTVAWFFVDQSQFFATHSNQRDCFILYRRHIRSNGSFRVRRSGQRSSSESQRKLVGAG